MLVISFIQVYFMVGVINHLQVFFLLFFVSPIIYYCFIIIFKEYLLNINWRVSHLYPFVMLLKLINLTYIISIYKYFINNYFLFKF